MLNHLAAITVLTSRLTCGAGELTTLAFRVDPRTRSFGEPTARLLTANRSKPVMDARPTVAFGADRTERPYDGPIVPDQPVNSGWTMFQTKLNPVVLAVVE